MSFGSLMSLPPQQLGGERGVFGYLPGHPDLVRVRASSREVRALESWLERGQHQARWEMGSGFALAYPWLTHRFIFRPDNSAQALIGVVYASQDSHSRPFPFVAFAPLPTASWDDGLLDIVRSSEPLFADFESLVQEVAALPQLGQVHSRVLHGNPPPAVDASAAAELRARSDTRYQNFLEEVTCGELGPPGSGVALCRELGLLLRSDGASPRDPRSIRTAIELPLHRPPLARELELRFYLELCLQLLAPARPTLTLFWKLGGPETGSLILCFREPTIDVFCGLIRRGAPSRSIVRPGREGSAAPPPGSLIWKEDTSLRALLDSLDSHRGRRTAPAVTALG
jgi:type VI secretion system ImpM family protein